MAQSGSKTDLLPIKIGCSEEPLLNGNASAKSRISGAVDSTDTVILPIQVSLVAAYAPELRTVSL